MGDGSNTNLEERLIFNAFIVFQFHKKVCYFCVIKIPVQKTGIIIKCKTCKLHSH